MLLQGCVNGGVYPVVQVVPPPKEQRTAPVTHAKRSGRPAAVERDDGAVFPSLASAGAEMGVTGKSIWQAINTGFTCKGHRWHYLGEEWAEPRKSASTVVTCVETGQTWSSLKEAAQELGVARSCLGKHSKNGKPLYGLHYRRGR